MVKFLDLAPQAEELSDDIHRVLDDILKNTCFIKGKYVQQFEREFADYIGTKYCVGCNSGTDALILALRALGIGPDSEVLVQSNTFFATIEAVRLVGAKALYCDCDRETGQIDLESAAKWLQALKPDAIIPVHLYGLPAPMDEVMEFAAKHNMAVIEDAAQAHGAIYKGKKVGSIGDIGCFSFYPGKNLGAYGDGGAVVTDNESLATKVAELGDHGSPRKFEHTEIGYNSRLDAIQAAILSLKLKDLDARNAARARIALQYNNAFKDVDGVTPLIVPKGCSPVWHIYPILVENPKELQEKLAEQDIQSGFHYPVPCHRQPAFGMEGDDLGWPMDVLSDVSYRAEHQISLPMYPEMTPEDVELVVKAVRGY